MATTRTSKIQVRQGNFTDLPVLDPGELILLQYLLQVVQLMPPHIQSVAQH